jgi:kinetochore protein Spc24
MLSDSSHLQDAKKTLQDLIPLLNWDDDYVTILTADQCMQKTAIKRKKELDDLHAKLKVATKTLEAARSSSTRPASVPSAELHIAAINDLQTQRISLAKAISDAEGLLATKEAELSQLKEEAKDLRESDPAKDHGDHLTGDVFAFLDVAEPSLPCFELIFLSLGYACDCTKS